MTERADFKTLLRQVEAADSPLDKIRAVALAWRTLRSLSPQERADLATTMGLDEAGTLIERMAQRKGGLAPSMVLEAVRAAQKEEPSKLRDLVRGLGSSKGRKQAVVAGLQQMEARLAGEPRAEAEAEAEESGIVFPEPEIEAEIEEQLESIPPLPAGLDPEPEPAPPPVRPPEAPAPEPPAPEPAERSSPVPVPVPVPEVRPVPPSRLDPPRLESSDPPPPPGPGDEPSLTERFRRLRELVDEGRPLGGEALASLVESFPPGWARRRALVLLLRSGLAAGTARAIALISGLESQADRLWCAAALVDSAPLSDAAFEELLETLDHASARRRLSLRRGAEGA